MGVKFIKLDIDAQQAMGLMWANGRRRRHIVVVGAVIRPATRCISSAGLGNRRVSGGGGGNCRNFTRQVGDLCHKFYGRPGENKRNRRVCVVSHGIPLDLPLSLSLRGHRSCGRTICWHSLQLTRVAHFDQWALSSATLVSK